MTSLYFVRHAQPDYRSGTDSSYGLSEEGMEDRLYAAELLRGITLNAAYCSTYRRSIMTIEPIALERGLEIITDIRLRERDKGTDGNSTPEMFRKRWADHSFHEAGGECLAQTQARNIEAVNEILASCPGMNVLVGTHGTSLSTIINYYDGSFGINDFMRIVDYMPWVIRLDFEGREYIGRQELGFVKKEFHGQR